MRYIAILLLVFVALTSVETRTVVSGDTFILDDVQYTIVQTYEDQMLIEGPGLRSIFEEDECVLSETMQACVDSSENLSGRIEILEKEIEVEFTRELPSTASVGQRIQNRLTMHNTGELPVTLLIQDDFINGSLSGFRGYSQDLVWGGVLQIDEIATIGYDIVVVSEENIDIVSTITGDIEEEEDDSVTVSDILRTSVDYTENPSLGNLYNFTFDLQGSPSSQEEAFVQIYVPDGLRISDEDLLTRVNDSLWQGTLTLNTTHELYITYEPLRTDEMNISVFVETDANETIIREYIYTLRPQEFIPIAIRVPESVVAQTNQSTEVEFLLHNPNNRSVNARYTLSSVLQDDSGSLSFSALTNQTRSYTVTAEQAGSYGLRMEVSYTDANNDDILSTGFARIEVSDAPEVIRVPDLEILGPQLLRDNETALLVLTALNIPAQSATISWERDGQLLFAQQTSVASGDTFNYSISEPGTYLASLELTNETLTQQFVVAGVPVFTNTTEMVSGPIEQESSSYGLFVVVLVLLLIGAVLIWRVRSTVVRAKEHEIHLALLAHTPRTAHEARMREELLAQYRDKKQ